LLEDATSGWRFSADHFPGLLEAVAHLDRYEAVAAVTNQSGNVINGSGTLTRLQAKRSLVNGCNKVKTDGRKGRTPEARANFTTGRLLNHNSRTVKNISVPAVAVVDQADRHRLA